MGLLLLMGLAIEVEPAATPVQGECQAEALSASGRLLFGKRASVAAEHFERTFAVFRREQNGNPFRDLFPLSRMGTLLQGLGHLPPVSGCADGPPTADDLKVLKRVKGGDGEWWSGLLEMDRVMNPHTRRIDADRVHAAYTRQNFTILINSLHRRSLAMHEISRDLSLDFGYPVSINAYVTPPHSQGFEAHWDYMESYIVQISGVKTWTLAQGGVPLSRSDLIYKPKNSQIGETIATIDMRPGDVMYLPSGVVHQAHTSGTESVHLTIAVEVPDTCTISSLAKGVAEAVAFSDISVRKVIRDAIDTISDMPSAVTLRRALPLRSAALFKLRDSQFASDITATRPTPSLLADAATTILDAVSDHGFGIAMEQRRKGATIGPFSDMSLLRQALGVLAATLRGETKRHVLRHVAERLEAECALHAPRLVAAHAECLGARATKPG